jgi:hypothetical protein
MIPLRAVLPSIQKVINESDLIPQDKKIEAFKSLQQCTYNELGVIDGEVPLGKLVNTLALYITPQEGTEKTLATTINDTKNHSFVLVVNALKAAINAPIPDKATVFTKK